jgi:hypothetical protein
MIDIAWKPENINKYLNDISQVTKFRRTGISDILMVAAFAKSNFLSQSGGSSGGGGSAELAHRLT